MTLSKPVMNKPQWVITGLNLSRLALLALIAYELFAIACVLEKG